MALLIVVLRCMVKGIRLGLTPMLHNRSSIEVGRDAECAASSAFAVRAVADAMHRGQRVDSDGGLPTGTGCSHLAPFKMSGCGLTFELICRTGSALQMMQVPSGALA
jgi:hypothetical protein